MIGYRRGEGPYEGDLKKKELTSKAGRSVTGMTEAGLRLENTTSRPVCQAKNEFGGMLPTYCGHEFLLEALK